MKFLEKILLVVDFIDHDNKNLVDAAIHLSRIFNSKIVVLNVISGRTDDKSVRKYLHKYASEEMEKLVNTFKNADVHHKIRIVEGSPFEQIIESSEKEDFNLILAGPGKTGSDIQRPGITIRKLIRKSAVPVWVIKEAPRDGFKDILCPVDFSDSSRRALTNAILLSSKMKANLKIISVFEPVEVISGRISDDLDEHNEKSFNSYVNQFDNFIEEYNLSGINISTEVMKGKPEIEILEELRSGKYDLLLMGTTGKSGLSRILIGSVTEKVIEESPVSFITTRKKNIINAEFELKISQLEMLLKEAGANMENGEFEKAGELYVKCLDIDSFLLPAIKGAFRAFRKAGKEKKAKHYALYEKEIERRLWRTGKNEG